MDVPVDRPSLTADEPAWGLGDVFTIRDYERRTYRFRAGGGRPDVLVPVDASGAASTDFDLTGQIVWLVSVLTSHYVASVAADEVRGQAVLELGAGAGLVGLTAAAAGAASVVLTAEEPEVLALLERNARLVPRACAAAVHALSWGDAAEHARLAAATGHARWRVIVGADVVYWSVCIAPLVASIAALLAADGVFIHGYTNRVDSNLVTLLAAADAAGLRVEATDRTFAWLAPLTGGSCGGGGGGGGSSGSDGEMPTPAYGDHLLSMTIFRWTWKAGRGPTA